MIAPPTLPAVVPASLLLTETAVLSFGDDILDGCLGGVKTKSGIYEVHSHARTFSAAFGEEAGFSPRLLT
jgi:hypothetical protein